MHPDIFQLRLLADNVERFAVVEKHRRKALGWIVVLDDEHREILTGLTWANIRKLREISRSAYRAHKRNCAVEGEWWELAKCVVMYWRCLGWLEVLGTIHYFNGTAPRRVLGLKVLAFRSAFAYAKVTS